ncbi:hypothetical protein SNL152K_8650 [Streptomyces sp. NL15-2K]|nr:hypothetical protein SNL152K_8650 [Streptomyces sp. NL15-2K]
MPDGSQALSQVSSLPAICWQSSADIESLLEVLADLDEHRFE